MTVSKALAAEGASVVVNNASSKASADSVVAAIVAAGGKVVAVGGVFPRPQTRRALLMQLSRILAASTSS
jgi:3-oxoacyl-[acyl-carrier protein] reductase